MTDATPIAQTAGVDPNQAVHNAADNANEHTPETPKLDDPPAAPQPAAPADNGSLTALQEMVAGLATTVSELTNIVMSQGEKSTVKVPWTMRGGKS